MSLRLAALLLLAACDRPSPEDTAPETDTDDEIQAIENPTHDIDIQPIWDVKCHDCHTTFNEGGLRLVDSYDRIINVRAEDTPAISLIEPFEPDGSYMWHKIEGTHETVGGSGGTMPKGALDLAEHERITIRNWIENGAPR